MDLYAAECLMMLLSGRAKNSGTIRVIEVLKVIVKFCFHLASNTSFVDMGRKYETLKSSLSTSEDFSTISSELIKGKDRLHFFSDTRSTSTETSFVRLVMSYVRSVGSGQTFELLGEVFESLVPFVCSRSD